MKRTILIVDDEELNRSLLKQMFQEEYNIEEAANGKDALEILEKNFDDILLILLDIRMPIMDGLSVMQYMKEKGWLRYIPAVLITADRDKNVMKRGYELGASDFIVKPFDRNIVVTRVNNVIELYEHKNSLETLVKEQTKQLNDQLEMMKSYHENLTKLLQDIISYRNIESRNHVLYVQGYTWIIANEYAKQFPRARMTPKKINMIVQAAQLHDVGKITLPDSLLSKAGRLSPSELKLLEEHTIKGSELIRAMINMQEDEYSRICINVCRYHHEKYDGSGYPEGRKKNKIPLEAQIVALADIYDVLVNGENGKRVISKQEAYYHLMQGDYGELAPRMKQCLEAAKDELERFII